MFQEAGRASPRAKVRPAAHDADAACEDAGPSC